MRSRKNIVIGLCLSLVAVLVVAGSMLGEINDTRVADAAMDGNKELLRSLIKQAADVNSSQGDGMTALHWAALHGDAENVQLLINAGANLRAVTRLGSYSPLYMAAKTGSAPAIDMLLKAGADAKAKSNTGITALHMAAISGDAESVRLLGERGADVNARETERGQTPLAYAASFDRPDAIKMLLRLGADPNLPSKEVPPMPLPARGENQAQPPQPQQGQQGQPPAQPAAQQARGGIPQVPGTPAAQQQAQNNGGNNNNNNGADAGSRGGGNPKGLLTPLMYASRQGSTNAVRVLTEGGANLNALNGDKSTALLLTIINGHFDIAKYLVERGANVNLFSMDGATPLYGVVNTQWARKSFHPQPSTKYEKTSYLELMTTLLDRGADPNVRLYKELWYSEYNFSLESAGAVGTTAFWKCAEVGDIDGMRLLVSRGADPTIASSEGVTSLLMAAGAGVHGNDDISAPVGRLAAVKYLVEEVHLDVNAADTGGNARIQGNIQEPQQQAQQQGQQPQQGQQQAQAQQQQQQQQGFGRPSGGFTALHSAAARGDNEMIIYLVSKGGKIDAVSKNGVSVVDMANGPRQRIQPYPETVALLQMLGAKNSHKCVSC